MVMNLKTAFASVKAALMRRGRSAHDADDLLQEAWVRLTCYEREQPVHKPEAFLMRAALNLSIDAYRQRQSQGEEVLLEEVVLVDATPSAEAVLLAKERVARLGVCLGRLSEKTRDIVLAHRVDGLSYTEIARRHGISVNAVERHVTKATLLLTCWMEGW
jgi:RNA polymerase sigma-70 factor (ECF subfamily)